jgi:3-phosphoshikimate 1-carboxyvinyltransferase
MVSIIVKKSKINGSIRCPSSKSYSHRAIAIASLAKQQSTITNALLARDTLATLAGCRALGADIKHEGTTVQIKGRHNFYPPENVINAENSGTTIRLLTAMSSLVKAGYTVLTGDESLRKRPMQPILDALDQLGVEAYSTKLNGSPPIVVKGGGMKGGVARVDGSISSQFISGLLIAGIYADKDIVLKIKGNLVSKPYINATLATMASFGVATIEHTEDMLEYRIKSAEYQGSDFDVPSDFSTAALILSAGILVGEELKVKGLNFSLPQGDSRILEIMKQMGSEIKEDRIKGEVIVQGSSELEGGGFNLEDTPDLLPVVAILSLKAKSAVTITGVAHARVKETDRVANIARELTKFGADIKEFQDGLEITAPKVLRNASLEAYNDHRLFMAFTIASMLTEKSIVAGAESVDVSYPNFLSDMKEVGGRILQAPDRE